jgi:hypothetical protein
MIFCISCLLFPRQDLGVIFQELTTWPEPADKGEETIYKIFKYISKIHSKNSFQADKTLKKFC